MNIYLYSHITKINNNNNYISIPMIYNYINYYLNNVENIYPSEIIDFKNKKFCLIINKSGLNNEINYFYELLKDIDEIDNIKIYDNIIKNKSCYNNIDLLNIFNKYKFILCIENSYNNGYITEKIFNCLFAKTIPLYKGSCEILNYINKERFIDLRDLTENYIKKIKLLNNNEELYYNFINNNSINNKYYNENYNLKLKKFIDLQLEKNNIYKDYYDNEIIYDENLKNNIKNYNVIISGCCINVEAYIKKNIDIIDNIGEKFKNYIVIIYENDSIDNTRKILLKNYKKNYYYIFENDISDKIKSRIARIAYCRNKILDKIKTLSFNYDYLIMMDLDNVTTDKIVNTFDTCFCYDVNKWAGMFANQSDYYYDIFALRVKNFIEFNCWNEYHTYIKYTDIELNYENRSNIFNNYIGKYKTYIPPNKLINVLSAFGGFGIYNKKYIENINYSIENEECEHVFFNKNIIKNGGKLFINTRMINN